MNGSPDLVAGLNDLPVKESQRGDGLRARRGHVRDGYVPQTSMSSRTAQRGCSDLKAQGASTLDVVSRTPDALPAIQATLATGVQIKPLNDQSALREGRHRGGGARSRHRRRPHRDP